MKQILLFLPVFLGIYGQTKAQNEQYTKAMEGAIAKVSFQRSGEELRQTASRFERIAGAEPREWLPNYWAAYTYSLLSLKESDATQRDALLDKADAFYQKAVSQQPNNDELWVLQAHIAGNRLAVDPQNRWQQYGPVVRSALDKAKRLNPDNPRIYCLEGQSLFYTPEQFGGGKKVACPLLQRATEKMATFKAASPIHPNWGGETTNYLLKQCGGQ